MVSDSQVSESTLDMLALDGLFSSGLELGFSTPKTEAMKCYRIYRIIRQVFFSL